MKVEDLQKNTPVAYLVASRADKPEVADAHSETVAKQQGGADKVELSSYMPVVPSSERQQGMRTDRVAELKAQISSGSYQVSSQAVAGKMISKLGAGLSN